MNDTDMPPAAFLAEFVGFKPMETKPYIQIKLSIPMEGGNEMLAVLGWPKPGESVWVAVAKAELNAVGSTYGSVSSATDFTAAGSASVDLPDGSGESGWVAKADANTPRT